MKNLLIGTLFLSSLFIACNDGRENIENEPNENDDDTVVEVLSDEELLDKVQQQTLKYFWDYAEPNSKMAPERYIPSGVYPQNDAHIVTSGGTGFGLMAIVAGIERGFVPRGEAVQRLNHIADFLSQADRYHGAWSHWINGETGETKPFSPKDDGGDIVETSFLAQGMVVVREYLKNGSEEEQAVALKYDDLWKGIEWNWYTNQQNVMYWHWSPNYNWDMNFALEGYNECLITYVMAASSPNHAIDPIAYHQGWARSGGITSPNQKYGLPLYLKHNGAEEYGGPLFWSHYSYLGLNPNGLSDQYANYWEANKNHVMIDYQYCVENPKGFAGYGEDFWGLTASYTRNPDGTTGYTAHMPSNDTGVISPTAAVSSIPYAPEEAKRFIRNIYENYNELSWGSAGFYDAMSLEYDWSTKRYLAIDQGPMVVMIENYRSGLIWNLFMQAPEIQNGLNNLGFTFQK